MYELIRNTDWLAAWFASTCGGGQPNNPSLWLISDNGPHSSDIGASCTPYLLRSCLILSRSLATKASNLQAETMV